MKRSLGDRIFESGDDEKVDSAKYGADPGPEETEAESELLKEVPDTEERAEALREKKKSKKEKLVEALLAALGVGSDAESEDDDEDEVVKTVDREIRAKMPRKILVKMKPGERVHEFSLSFYVSFG